jgi:hypothetical protein
MAATAPKTGSGTAPPPDADTDTGKTASTGLSRAVIWTGIALGTALAVLAMTDGARLRLGAMPGWLGVILGAVIVWALIVLAAVTLAELTRRHHATVRRHAIRQGKRGALATGREARKHGRWLIDRAAAWAAPRWQNRGHQPRQAGEPESPPADQDPVPAGAPTYSWGRADMPSAWPTDNPEHAHSRARHASTVGKPYVVTEYPPGGGPGRTIATYLNGKPSPPTEGSTTMTDRPAPRSRITPDRRARRTAGHAGGTVPAEWGPVVAQAADFEPESDEHLLEWMTDQVNGMAAYAEALIEAYETGVGAVGIDPKGLAALHDVADAAAHAAESMSGAKTTFTDHYELPREFAANGGLMTHDGRWVTGEGG